MGAYPLSLPPKKRLSACPPPLILLPFLHFQVSPLLSALNSALSALRFCWAICFSDSSACFPIKPTLIISLYFSAAMGRRRHCARIGKNHPRQIDSLIFPGKDASPCTPDNMEYSVSLRESVGDDLYYRIMQWNDSGAAEALKAAQQRRIAKAKGKPCWVPKMKTDMYIGKVDWDKRDSGDAYYIPLSAGALAEELFCETYEVDRLDTQQDGHQSAYSGSQLSKPTMEKLHPIKPTAWGDVAAEAEAKIFSTPMDSPTLAEVVLEESVDGQRLLLNGRPLEPSGWDQLDTNWPNWPQFGWDPSGLIIEAKAQSGWQDTQFYHASGLYNVYQSNSFANDPQLGAAVKSGWKDDLWYQNRYGGFHQGHYMAAF